MTCNVRLFELTLQCYTISITDTEHSEKNIQLIGSYSRPRVLWYETLVRVPFRTLTN